MSSHDERPRLAAAILAGHSRHEDDPLAEYTLERPKGMIAIAGRPMIAFVVDALAGSRYVQRIVIIGLSPTEQPPLSVPVEYLPPGGGIMDHAEAALRHIFAQTPDLDGALICSADLPLITPPIVDRYVETCLQTDHDLYYGVIERSVMEGRFPTSRRTYVRLTDGEFAGGDLILVRRGATTGNRDLWRRLAAARKSPLRQALMLGLWPTLKLLVGRLSLAEAERYASHALGIRGRVIVCPYPELGMDVDKPFQLEIARAELEARARVAAG